ncbi:hypothetical protein DPMN_172089 [Dreissena polymorpha]|uniref:Uncharacterized protein n=1 Tax=Dreissena polymorpha TaxID=45954 RepID=A0A9D4ID08_DREPO|nr:hypothetical protein DPMN_172089 [Dreissena polymorpha]
MCPCNGRYPRFEARRFNRRPTDESCTVCEFHPNVFRGRPRLSNILDIDLALDDSDVFMPWRHRYPRFEARQLNRRHNDEWCTVGECNPNVFRGCPRQLGSHSVITISAVHLNITKRLNIINNNLFGRVGGVSQSKLFRKRTRYVEHEHIYRISDVRQSLLKSISRMVYCRLLVSNDLYEI